MPLTTPTHQIAADPTDEQEPLVTPADRTDQDSGSGPRGGGRSMAWFVAVPAATFVLGAVLGGLVIGVGEESGPGAGGTTPSASPSSSGPSTAVVVPDSCLEAAETVREATETIRGGVEAIQEFRVDPILELLDDLEDLDALAREQAATCTGTRVTDSGEPTEAPTDEPADEPTSTETP